MKDVKVEWCENFIKARFTKHHPFPGGGIEVHCFWKMAEASGLYERGTYGSPMSEFEDVRDEDGNICYTVFKLA